MRFVSCVYSKCAIVFVRCYAKVFSNRKRFFCEERNQVKNATRTPIILVCVAVTIVFLKNSQSLAQSVVADLGPELVVSTTSVCVDGVFSRRYDSVAIGETDPGGQFVYITGHRERTLGGNGGRTVFVEQGVMLGGGGGGTHQIFVASGASVSDLGGGGHTIYVESGGYYVCNNSDKTIFFVEGASIDCVKENGEENTSVERIQIDALGFFPCAPDTPADQVGAPLVDFSPNIDQLDAPQFVTFANTSDPDLFDEVSWSVRFHHDEWVSHSDRDFSGHFDRDFSVDTESSTVRIKSNGGPTAERTFGASITREDTTTPFRRWQIEPSPVSKPVELPVIDPFEGSVIQISEGTGPFHGVYLSRTDGHYEVSLRVRGALDRGGKSMNIRIGGWD